MLAGIDVSAAWNGQVDWRRVQAAGITFAFCKCSEGISFTDPMFAEHWSGMSEVGVIRGAYHYARPQPGRTGADEGNHMLAALDRAGYRRDDLPPVLSLQWQYGPLTPDALHAWVTDFVGTVQSQLHCRPIICTGEFWTRRLGERSSLGCPLWVTAHAPRPQLPSAWPGWTFWQRTPRARLDGVGGDVDLDYYPGTREQLVALCGEGASGHEPTSDNGSANGHRPMPQPPFPGFPLAEGIAGPEVRSWQRRMLDRGWTITVDAVYGAKSAAICERFQSLHSLRTDGVVDRVTWDATFAEP